MNPSYKISAEQAINEFVKRYCLNPLNFFYEADIQGILFAKIFNEFSRKKHLIEIYKNKWVDNIPINLDLVSPLKREYPRTRTAKFKEIDICIIDNQYDPDKIDNFWDLPIQAGIEIKYCQYNEQLIDKFGFKKSFFPKREHHFNYDLYKLKSYSIKHPLVKTEEFSGCGLLFVQHFDYMNYNNKIDGKNIIEYLGEKFKIKKADYITLDIGINGWIIFPDCNIYRYNYD